MAAVDPGDSAPFADVRATRLPVRAARLAESLGAIASAAALLSLIGWYANFPRLTDWDGSGVSMQPNTAIAALCCGTALVLLRRRAAAARLLAAISAAIGAATLLEHVTGVGLAKFDTLLLPSRAWGQRLTVSAGRMGLPASICFVFLGLGLVCSAATQPRWRRCTPTFALVVAVVGMTSIVGLLFGAAGLHALPHATAIALQTAMILVPVGCALALSVPEAEPVRLFLREEGSGLLARRLLPYVVSIPIVLGWLRLIGQDVGLYDLRTGTALLVVMMTVVICIVLWRTVRHVAAREEDVRAREQWLRLALDAGRYATFDYERESGVIHSTERFRELFGFPAHAEPGIRDVESRIHPHDRARVLGEWNRAIDERRRSEIDYRVAAQDGSWRWLSSVVRALPGRDGRHRLLGVTLDVTERHTAEQSLRDADRKKDEFLATLAHELRNPLAPVLHSLEVLDRAAEHPEASERARVRIKRQIQHIVRLVDDLFDVSRIREGKVQLKLARIDVGQAVLEAAESSRSMVDRAGQSLSVDWNGEPIHVDADPVRLVQVLGNLLNNASRYTGRGGSIRISLRASVGFAEVEVADNGAGIAREMLPKIFDMFTQAGRPADGPAGLGIGLTLVRKLVELHGGDVSVSSEGPGRGSSFRVRLPLAVERRLSPRPAPLPATERAPATGRRILVVDDNRDGAESLTELLRLIGHDAEATFDGSSAVKRAPLYRPEIILLDIGLPEMSGYEVCRAVRSQPGGREIAIVAVTGWGQDADRERTRDAGFNAHLVKPVSFPDLLELIASLPGAPRGSQRTT